MQGEARLVASGPLDEKPDGLKPRQLVGVSVVSLRGDRHRRHPVDRFPLDPQRFPARDQDPEAGARVQQPHRQRSRRVADMLAVVEHEQLLAVGQAVGDRVDEFDTCGFGDAESVGQRPYHLGGIGHRGQLRQPHTIARLADGGLRRPQGQSGLAHAAGAGEGDESGARQEPGDLAELLLPTDERRELGRQVVRLGFGLTAAGMRLVRRGRARRARRGRRGRRGQLGGSRQRLVLAEDRAFEPHQLRAGLYPELLAEHRSYPLVGPEGVSLTPAAVQGQDQLRPQPFTKRVFSHRRLRRTHHLVMLAERDPRLQPRFEAGRPQLLEPNHLGCRPSRAGGIGQGGPPPPAQPPPEGVGGSAPVGVAQRRPPRCCVVFEEGHIQFSGGDGDQVGTVVEVHPVGAEGPAQQRHVALERGGRTRRSVAVPKILSETFDRDRVIGRDEETGQ